jgi:peptidoglycan/LPS O-acetylase OafA/YrhL
MVEQLLKKFSRETSSGRFIPQLDGLRFIAIAAVVLFHLSGYVAAHSPVSFSTPPSEDQLARLMAHGHYGVQFFFIISGFILALPFASHYLHATPRVDLSAYYLRRLTRLEPPYLLSLIAFCAVLLLINGEKPGELFQHLIAGFVYLHNIIYGSGNRINSVAWSLEVEVQFYLLVPLLTKLFAIRGRLRRRMAIVTLGLAAIIFQAFFILTTGGALALSILGFLQFFLIGFLLADFYLCEWNRTSTRRWTWDVVTVAGWLSLPFIWASGVLIAFVFPVVALLLYCAVFRGTLTYRVLGNRWLTTIGGMCYSIYLLHYPIVNFIGSRSKSFVLTSNFDINLLLQLTIVAPVLLVISGAFFLLVEKPCMRKDWPRRILEKLRSALWLQPQPAKASELE